MEQLQGGVMVKKAMIAAGCVALMAMAVATGATAAGQGEELARGKTGQGRKIRLRVGADRVKLIGFSIELRCSGGYTLVDEESDFLPSTVSRKGRVHDAQVGSTDEVLIRGHVTTGAVRGRIRVRDRLGKHRCSSPWVRFTAHRR
jgi:hypothetical protein